MILSRFRFISIAILALTLLTLPALASAEGQRWSSRSTIVEILANTDGAQALVAAVLVVDEAQVLDFSLVSLLGDRRADLVVFAPSNAAFENLLGLDPGSLNGLSVEEVKAALPGALPSGVGPNEVAAILLKHVGQVRRASSFTVSQLALLRRGQVTVADGSELPVGIGVAGVEVNNETTIIRKDIRARNGYVHFVDTVILDGLL